MAINHHRQGAVAVFGPVYGMLDSCNKREHVKHRDKGTFGMPGILRDKYYDGIPPELGCATINEVAEKYDVKVVAMWPSIAGAAAKIAVALIRLDIEGVDCKYYVGSSPKSDPLAEYIKITKLGIKTNPMLTAGNTPFLLRLTSEIGGTSAETLIADHGIAKSARIRNAFLLNEDTNVLTQSPTCVISDLHAFPEIEMHDSNELFRRITRKYPKILYSISGLPYTPPVKDTGRTVAAALGKTGMLYAGFSNALALFGEVPEEKVDSNRLIDHIQWLGRKMGAAGFVISIKKGMFFKFPEQKIIQFAALNHALDPVLSQDTHSFISAAVAAAMGKNLTGDAFIKYVISAGNFWANSKTLAISHMMGSGIGAAVEQRSDVNLEIDTLETLRKKINLPPAG